MQVYESIFSAALSGPTYLTIGNFDGVHRGHAELISVMREAAWAEGAASGLLTFHPHPRAVLLPGQSVPYLTSLSERLSLYAKTGLDFAIVHPFSRRTAQTEAEDFMQLLHSHLGVTKLWVGPDFALGKDRRGTVSFLQTYGEQMGIAVEVFPEFYWEGHEIRASRIRHLIEIGNVEWAGAWLGRYYSLPGIIVQGVQRGRSIGFPTANLSLAQGRVVPANGVYATWAWVEGQRFPSVTNIGVRPTVQGSHRTVEAHIIDFDEDLYGRCLTLEFVYRLRDETKFAGIEALKAQIARDRDRAALLLSADPRIPSRERFQEEAHTADWVVRVIGDSRAALYANAALAMFSLQGAAEIDGPTIQQFVEVDAGDRESLMVSWLNELLWLAETEEVAFQHFWIETIDDTRLRAWVVGRGGRSDMAHIKAVTYHELEVLAPESDGGDWSARVLFDT